MNKTVKYPIEAFALAMVLFSSGMKEAMLVGIVLIFGDVLLNVIAGQFQKPVLLSVEVLGALVTVLAIYGALKYNGADLTTKELFGLLFIALFLVKHFVQDAAADFANGASVDFSKVLTIDTCVYIGFVLLGMLREYISGGVVFSYPLVQGNFIKSGAGNAFTALIGAGIVLLIIDKVFSSKSSFPSGMLVCLSVLLLEVPFTWQGIPEISGKILGVIIVAVLYVA